MAYGNASAALAPSRRTISTTAIDRYFLGHVGYPVPVPPQSLVSAREGTEEHDRAIEAFTFSHFGCDGHTAARIGDADEARFRRAIETLVERRSEQ